MSVEDTYVVGLGTNKNFNSKIVRAVTKGWCSHAWIEYYSARFGAFWVIHTCGTVVRERVFDVWRRYPIRKRYEVHWQLAPGIEKAGEYIGTPYDWRSTIANSILLVAHNFTKHEYEIVRDSSLFNCSELASSILKWSNFPEEIDPEATSPIVLDGICKNSRYMTELTSGRA